MSQHNEEIISIEEFIARLPEWNIQQYVTKISGNPMLGLKGANFVAYKCGISIIEAKKVDETEEYIESVATAKYRDRTDIGTKRQYKIVSGKEVIAPLAQSFQKARRNAICNLLPHDVIVGKATMNEENKYFKAAKAIETAELAARAAAPEVAANLKSLGINVEFVSKKAQAMNGDDTSIWGVMQWNGYEDMLRNPDKWGLTSESKKALVDEGDNADVDESDSSDDEDVDSTDDVNESNTEDGF